MKSLTDSPLIPRARQFAWLTALLTPSFLFLVVFLIVPFLGMIRLSFYPGQSAIGASGFSLEQYGHLFSDGYFFSVLLDTFLIGLEVAVICLIFGFPIGYSLARLPAERRKWRLIIVILPLTLSLVVIVFGWMVVLGRSGMVNRLLEAMGVIDSPMRLMFNAGAVVFVLVQQFIPFMILSVMSVVSQIDSTLEEAAANLGANRLHTILRIILPLSAPGMASGFLLVFILTISAFITPRLVGGNKVQMLGNVIYEQILVVLNWPLGATLGIFLMVITFSLFGAVHAARLYLRSMK